MRTVSYFPDDANHYARAVRWPHSDRVALSVGPEKGVGKYVTLTVDQIRNLAFRLMDLAAEIEATPS